MAMKIDAKYFLRVGRARENVTRMYGKLPPLFKNKCTEAASFAHATLDYIMDYIITNSGVNPPSDASTVMKHDEVTIRMCNRARTGARKIYNLLDKKKDSEAGELHAHIQGVLKDFQAHVTKQIKRAAK